MAQPRGHVTIEPLPAADVPGHRAGLVGVYAAAFSEPPYREPAEAAERFAESLAVHSARDGFRLRVARSPPACRRLRAGRAGGAPGAGTGVGGALHDALLERTGPRRAVLSTLDADTPAMRLYRGRGWRVIGHFAPVDAGRFAVLAVDPPARGRPG